MTLMRRRRTPPGPDLKPHAVAVLLQGWCSPEPPVPAGDPDFGGGFLALYRPDGPGRLWREHERWLRRVAREWGWSPDTVGPDGVTRFWAEHVATFGER